MSEFKDARKSCEKQCCQEQGQTIAGQQPQPLGGEDKLLAAEEKAREYEDLLKRLQAEFENYKKRVAKENEQHAFFEGETLALKLLPFLDDFDAALQAAEKTGDSKLKENLCALHAKLSMILSENGLTEMNCVGNQFDPYKHEAVACEPSDKNENEVVRVIRKGYLFRGKILRHALVSVSKGVKRCQEK